MIIRFTKGQDKGDSIACFREDGTSTWARANVGVRHDLIHYVVETTLGLEEAFYGLLAAGWDIHDFGTLDPRTGRKPAIPAEAGQAEHLVGVLQQEMRGTLRFEEVAGTPYGESLPALAPEVLAQLRHGIRELFERWEHAPAGGYLELEFRLRDGASGKGKARLESI